MPLTRVLIDTQGLVFIHSPQINHWTWAIPKEGYILLQGASPSDKAEDNSGERLSESTTVTNTPTPGDQTSSALKWPSGCLPLQIHIRVFLLFNCNLLKMYKNVDQDWKVISK